jgi:hypothetical protein
MSRSKIDKDSCTLSISSRDLSHYSLSEGRGRENIEVFVTPQQSVQSEGEKRDRRCERNSHTEGTKRVARHENNESPRVGVLVSK